MHRVAAPEASAAQPEENATQNDVAPPDITRPSEIGMPGGKGEASIAPQAGDSLTKGVDSKQPPIARLVQLLRSQRPPPAISVAERIRIPVRIL